MSANRPGIVAEDMIGKWRELNGAAILSLFRARIKAVWWILDVIAQIVADIKIKVRIIIEISPRRRGGPITFTAKTSGRGRVLERAVSSVPIECVSIPTRDEKVRVAIVVKITDSHSVAISAGKPVDAGTLGGGLQMCHHLDCERGGRRTNLIDPGGKGPPCTT